MVHKHVTAGVRCRWTAVAAILFALGAALVFTAASSPSIAAGSTCSGRALLTCGEKSKISGDYLTWAGNFVLDLELSEITLPARLRDPSILSFWRAEAATAAARSLLDVELVLELPDPNFETIATAARYQVPVIAPDRALPRPTARAMEQMLGAEWEEVSSLRALLQSLNRASDAINDRARPDWERAQLAVGAHFAARAARALRTIIGLQPRVARALQQTGLKYGVGPVDLRLAKRRARAHGIEPRVLGLMSSLGLNPAEIQFCETLLLKANAGGAFTLGSRLANGSTQGTERALYAALKSFVARTPPAPKPTH